MPANPLTDEQIDALEAAVRRGLDLANLLSGDVPISAAARAGLDAAYKALSELREQVEAGRQAGMREAAEILQRRLDKLVDPHINVAAALRTEIATIRAEAEESRNG